MHDCFDGLLSLFMTSALCRGSMSVLAAYIDLLYYISCFIDPRPYGMVAQGTKDSRSGVSSLGQAPLHSEQSLRDPEL